ncbi:hypothetical protein Gorai_000376 [Gossypium raimondii]|uniref:Reverse transcriptase domain-containing protein n=1 Tax=Gossypium raimondii TaxID=29730 RepID=A0A7J8PDE0_GOSRA|nr:hypothetical protein [Gossypium raimondii]
MKLLCWNYCGIGNPVTVWELKMEGCMVVNAIGRSGGLAMMWKEGIKVEIKNYFSNHIDSLIHIENHNPIRFTSFYGNADPKIKKARGKGLRGRGAQSRKLGLLVVILMPSLMIRKWKEVNNRDGIAMVKERLNCFMISASDITNFPFIETKVIHQSNSDHDAIVLDTIGCKPREGSRDLRFRFKYDNGGTADIMGKFEKMGHALGLWQYKRATSKRKKNNIDRVKDINGCWKDNTNDICAATKEYFQNLFVSTLSKNEVLNLDYIEKNILGEMNKRLAKEFTVNEIKEAFNQMDPQKALGIDKLSESFFKENWKVVGVDIIKLWHEVVSGNRTVDSLNETIIVLIPKIKEPIDMTNFWPISLCKVIYKIIAKVLANRLKDTLLNYISQNQRAFVPGRLIHENILIAHELVHYLRSAKNGPNKGFVIKLNMNKADSSIARAAEALKEGFVWLVGDDNMVDIRRDKLGFEGLNRDSVYRSLLTNDERKVSDLWDNNRRYWKRERVIELYGNTMGDQIWNLPIIHNGVKKQQNVESKPPWVLHVKADLLLVIPKENRLENRSQYPATYDNIARICHNSSNVCPRCKNREETLIHGMKDYPMTREILALGGLNNRLLDGSYERCIDWLEDVLRKLDDKAAADFFTLL